MYKVQLWIYISVHVLIEKKYITNLGLLDSIARDTPVVPMSPTQHTTEIKMF